MTRRNLLGAGLTLVFAPGIARAAACRATPRDALGPFYKRDAPAQEDLCAGGSGGERKLSVTGRVLGMPDCAPLAGAVVEVWQADEKGHYSDVGSKPDDPRCLLRARVTSDREGRYRYTTVFPGDYPGRPRHIHYRVSCDGYATLVTQLYFDRRGRVPEAQIVSIARDAEGVAQAQFDITLAAAS